MMDLEEAPIADEVLAVRDLIARPADADGYVHLKVDEVAWTALGAGCASGLHDLSALWFDSGRMRMALNDSSQRKRAIVSIDTRNGSYPSIGRLHPPAIRLERAMRDLYATNPIGLEDSRPWLDHGVWPLQREGQPRAGKTYPFLLAEGDGLNQIPVGPVHAGIIEPGHFRFSTNGETIVRLEERLGYVHKGVEVLCAGAPIEKAAKIAARISGDSTVAYSLAFSRAVEAVLGWRPPDRAILLRGIMAELERLSHHINDVGAICNDASVIAVNAQCTLIREDILRTAGLCFGHRMMMDRIIPGGVSVDPDSKSLSEIRQLLLRIEAGFSGVIRVYDQSPSLQNRVVSTGTVSRDLARQYAAGGYVGRAAGRAFDARSSFPYPPYDGVKFEVASRDAGDVDARVWVRIEEVKQSISVIRQLLEALKPGPVVSKKPSPGSGEAAALVEAFRGDIFMFVRIQADGRVAHLHARDASWFQWPLLEAAIKGNIVADFPICNKSFNCSYSGHDI